MLSIKPYSNNSFSIINILTLNVRLSMKLKLFLESIDNIEMIYGNDEIIVTFQNIEEDQTAKILKELVLFFANTNIKCELDDEYIQAIHNYDNKISNIINKREIVFALKTSNYADSKEFIKFKKFCDKELVIKLRDYQYESAYLLSVAKNGFDFSVPGAGKTIITYAAYSYYKQFDDVKQLLVIGPKNAYNAWYDEYMTCFGKTPSFENLSNETVNYSKQYLCASIQNYKEITFINIEKIRNLKKELIYFLKKSKPLLVIDEGHKVKNPDASATKIALEIANYVDSKIILTGTPMPNGYEDLYSLTKIISPYYSILPFQYSKLKSFTVRGIDEKDEKKIMNSLYPYYSRVSKKYLINRGELRNPKVNIKFSFMSDEQRLIYDFLDGLITDFSNKWETEFSYILMKAILIRKMQVSANPKLLGKSLLSTFDEIKSQLFCYEEATEIDNKEVEELKLKLDIADKEIMREVNQSEAGIIVKKFVSNQLIVNKNQVAVDLAKELLEQNKKVILWEVFVGNMETLKNMIEEELHIIANIINGNIVGKERQNTINNFRNGNLKVLIASPATLAESISLHKSCQTAIYVNRNYNAAQFIQSKDRIHRINMPEGTTAEYFFLINHDSVDEAVGERLELKEKRMLRILDADDIVIGNIEFGENATMSEEDIKESYKK